jgi:predicted tellurium resistance membrane protein TerC
MKRIAFVPFVLDLLCVVVFAAIGTINHDTDTGLGGILYVSTPFAMSLLAVHVAGLAERARTITAGVVIWVFTVAVGMVLRNIAFNRGTATSFVVVASVFLGLSMLGWRVWMHRSRAAKRRPQDDGGTGD